MAMQCLANVSQDAKCLTSMKKKKYNLVSLLQNKLGCEHSKTLAAYLIDVLSKQEETPSHNDSNTEEASEKKDGGDDSDDDCENTDPSGKIVEPAASG